MTRPIPREQWPDRLESVVERCEHFRRVFMLHQTASTQDAARRMRAGPGDVIIAWNQTAGRGRLGRSWAGGTDGAAVTFVLRPGQTERLAIVGAIAAARAAEVFLGRRAGIKWPNDVLIDGRKLAGVLVEQTDRVALPAIGMNVSQAEWPGELASRAVSLHQLGVRPDRVEVVEALLGEMDAALRVDDDELTAAFHDRDVLVGAHLRLQERGRVIEGRLTRLDPLLGLVVATARGEVRLPAATTTVLEVSARAPGSRSAAAE